MPSLVWRCRRKRDEPQTGSARVARYVLEKGLVNTLKIAGIALVGSTLVRDHAQDAPDDQVPAVAGTHRLYIEIWRGLPILVTIFIIFYALPAVSLSFRFEALTAGTIALILWGSAQVAETTRELSSPPARAAKPPRRSASAGSADTRS